LGPLFLLEEILLAWPDQLSALSEQPLECSSKKSLHHLAALVRLGEANAAEPFLLDWLRQEPRAKQPLVLLAALRLQDGDLGNFKAVLQQLAEAFPSSLETRWLSLQHWLIQGDLQAIAQAEPQIWEGEAQSVWLRLSRVALLLKTLRLEEAQQALARLPQPPCLEALRLHARGLAMQGLHAQALALLKPALERAPLHRPLITQVLELVIDAREAPWVVPLARRALEVHGEHPELLCHVTTVKLFQRQPGMARRSALIQQVWASLRPTPINVANQLSTYEQTGHADWLEYLQPQWSANPLSNLQMHSNLAMQLASIESRRYPQHITSILEAVQPTAAYVRHREAGGGVPQALAPADRPLTIAWITADLCPHPVSRFLLGFFEASTGLRRHHHHLVSVMDHGTETNRLLFDPLPGLEVHDVSGVRDHERVAAIRALQPDLAIDLSGWTGGHFMAGFLARLAPVQVNYLGYFASAGVPQMDVWLGDSELFPANTGQWHTETIWRLPRPFLAWQPASALPEAVAAVTPPPQGGVRFGSFNHNRKLSDRTLRLWGAVLQAVPGSTLVLKANAKDDYATQELLRRRMLRFGLDPERVHWLPLAPTPEEHLQQYRHIDIALDPIPNGGCTTTCEALWMGVPVITLEGATYVSRMSTAVLCGAGLGDWVCPSEGAYVQLACERAADLIQLRSRRDRWRHHILSSPLGDAADLMQHLEHAFSAMHARALTTPSPLA
jgi:protein O-GlcNAc transferase